jgi:UDP-2,4-diacetamido-2,4,6-trideoxy-beta-L-altropyranose hydrolase/UDP-4-amino-4,6-dideoxy-N-acetyl-beta-L-altrosamine N-acetyltransferase
MMLPRMKVAFRVDASLQISIGHVMRCLTLADALKAKGAECHFISREHPGHMLAAIRQRGFALSVLPAESNGYKTVTDQGNADPAHAKWLGCSWQTDAEQCRVILKQIQPDWLIVDHYALDQGWETALRPYYRKLMVIDDLADRLHVCDLLLDQTFGRSPDDYGPWIPAGCTLLCGSQYALLRPEFAALRQYSLKRRENPQLEHLIITMGGVDKDNATGQILEALRYCALPKNCRITVVMGASAPWLTEVRQQAAQLPWPTDVRVNISDMAQLMAASDLAIGAAGSTSWERCCLGLPTVMVVLADNQRQVAQGLEQVGAVYLLQQPQRIIECLPVLLASLVAPSAHLVAMSQAASRIADGSGVATVIHQLELEVIASISSQERVRPMTSDDLERVLAWRNHEEVRRYMYTQHEISIAEHSCWFEQASHDSSRHLLVFESNAVPLGFINLHQIAPGGVADWGFYAAPDAPKGIGRQLGHAALQYAFNCLGLHKVCGQAVAYNHRSIKFHESLDFQQEGILREQHFDGQSYHDVVCFGLLAVEYQPNI